MRQIIITISDGDVIYVTGLPEPCEVEVRNYDIEHLDDEDLEELTHELLRVPTDEDEIGSLENGLWTLHDDGSTWTDVIIAPVEPR